ncbi:MAG TPA: hypothetical protein VG899_02730 [Mycobacteriales bacterium]|nr:hypothetical protein [Mycobacteriales bacterium]
MIGRIVTTAALAGLCCVTWVMPTGAATERPASRATVIEQVSPVGAGGYVASGYHVVRTLGGATCRSHSPTTGNAYSCHVRFGYDPCWVTATHPYVVCLSAPYDKSLTRLRVARWVNAGGLGKPAGLPWGLLLANGHRTTLIPGNFGTVNGQNIHYSYDDFRTVLVGPIDKSGEAWRIRVAKNDGRFRFKLTGWATITKAWVGAPTTLAGRP